MMTGIITKFERFIVLALLILMMIALLASTIELAIILVEQLLAPPMLLLDIKEMLTVFGFLLMVLIGLEFVETIKSHYRAYSAKGVFVDNNIYCCGIVFCRGHL